MGTRSEHWITRLKQTKIPHTHVCLDSEARIVARAGLYEHRFAVAATALVSRADEGDFHVSPGSIVDDLEFLWMPLSDLAFDLGGLVVWAQNLPYDLRVTDGLRSLIAFDWTLESISLARTASWASWRKGKAKLLVTDAYSWFHVKLDRLAAEQGSPRRRFDYARATDRQLAARCSSDVGQLARSVCDTLNFISAEGLGTLRPTGSGQSHAAWRRRFMPERSVRVHSNAKALLAERDAMHTGRAEAWRLGRIDEPLHEMDLNLAYCRIAAECDLPVALVAERAYLPVLELASLYRDYRILCDVRVEVGEPLVPVTIDERVVWPVGAFGTQLWDPELRLLQRHGAKFAVNYAWLYRRGTALQSMSRWLVEQYETNWDQLQPAVRRVLKHWARTLVGRMALRYSQWEYFGDHPRSDLCISYEPNPDTGEVARHMRVGNTMLELAEMSESKSSCPMVPGWVQSQCRALLWELIREAGFENVYYMDTDGLLVNGAGRAALKRQVLRGAYWKLVEKGTHHNVTIHGVRNVEIGGQHRLAGIPKSAVRKDEVTWEGETWVGLEAALEDGHTDYVSIVPNSWEVVPEHHRREPLPGGFTKPYRLDPTDDAGGKP